jgi:energy-coupling factor transporter transmembrane protein EcfT
MIHRILRLSVPLALFCAGVAGLQLMSGNLDPWLPVKTFGAFFAGLAAFACFPWRRLPRLLVAPPARRNLPILFLLILRHFAGILGAEAARQFRARRLVVVRESGPLGFTSLRCAVVSMFRRSIERAERFYAAQWLRGGAE